MKLIVLPGEVRPAPWGDPAADWPVLLRPARSWTEEALGAARARTSLAERTLVLPDNLLLSTEFVDDFLAIAATRPADRSLQAALGPGQAAARSAGRSSLPAGPDGSLPVPLLLLPASQGPKPESLGDLLALCTEAEPVVVDPAERSHSIPAPRAYADPGEDSIEVAASSRIALWLEHRSHLQQANLELLGATFLRTLGRPRVLLALRWLFDRLRPGPRRLFSRIGPGCRIHPTAIIEASSLGPGCEVGAHAIVRASVLGEGVTVEDGAHVQMSVLGDRSRVARQTAVFASILMEGSHSAQAVMQMSVLGRHSATTSASWFIDVRLTGTVRVEATGGEGLLDSGTRFLGCDVGHETFVGAGVTVAAGRMLPSRARIVAAPTTTLSNIGSVDPLDAEGGIYAVVDGSLEPIQ